MTDNKEILQNLFDTIKQHLLTQNEQATRIDNDDCVYRSSSGLKCAVGILIPDDEYIYTLENKGVTHVLENVKSLNYLQKNNKAISLLENLQNLHDNQPVEDWPDALEEIAEEFGLTTEDEPLKE